MFCININHILIAKCNRYRVNVDIMDSIASTTVTVFDKEAERLIGKDVGEMLTISKLVRDFF